MSDKYNYRKAVKDDVEFQFLERGIKSRLCDKDLAELQDDLFLCDDVTGNASGSYTMSRWTAEENLCHNLGLLSEVLRDVGFTPSELAVKLEDPEACDVIVRCYLLGEMMYEVNAALPPPEEALSDEADE